MGIPVFKWWPTDMHDESFEGFPDNRQDEAQDEELFRDLGLGLKRIYRTWEANPRKRTSDLIFSLRENIFSGLVFCFTGVYQTSKANRSSSQSRVWQVAKAMG